MAFQCSVVTPERQLFDAQVRGAVLPAHDGQVGILTNRAPLLVKLGAGLLKLTPDGGAEVRYFVEGGVAQMKDNVLTVLTDRADDPDTLDVAAARAELDQVSVDVGALDAGQKLARDRRIARARAIVALKA